MAIVRTILLVAFVIVCIFTILLVLVQNEERNGMGGVFGGAQSTAFGAHSASVLTKTTGVLAALFFIFTFCILLLNKVPSDAADLNAAAAELEGPTTETGTSSGSWLDDVDK